MNGSGPFRLSSADVKTFALNALKVAAGAGASFAMQAVSGHDFGQYNVLVAGIVAGLLDLLHKWIPDTRPPTGPGYR
jgi:hypothetical protein